MREAVIPFYSWLEINMKRYSRLVRNNFSEGWQQGIRASGTIAGVKGSFFLAKWLLRAAALTAGVAAYNRIFFPDEEEELSEYDKNRMHIVLGRNENGEVIILRGQTAFGDLLEWFGLDASPTLWREYHEGKRSLVELFGNIPGTDLPAFGLNPFSGKLGLHPAALKMVRGINPLYKLPVETMTGKALPVFDDRSWRVEDKTRNILKAVSLDNEYDALMKEMISGSAVFFPLAGALQGLLAVCVALVSAAFFSPEITSGLVLLTLVVSNGGFHLDGLADTFDALSVKSGGDHAADREKKLRVMKASTTGAIGVTAIGMVWLLKLLCLNNVISSSPPPGCYAFLFLMPVFSKWGMILNMYHGTSARPDGLGKMFIESITGVSVLLASLFLAFFYFAAERLYLHAIFGNGGMYLRSRCTARSKADGSR